MSDLTLGQRVKITGTVVKRKGHGRLRYEDSPPPRRLNYLNPVTYNEGVVVGSRTLMEGTVSYDEYGIEFAPTPATSFQVYLVAFDMRMRPCFCRPEQLTAVTR